mgnify:CR=1 FL=1
MRSLLLGVLFCGSLLGTHRGAQAEDRPSNRNLVVAGMAMAVPTYVLGVSIHEGSHALMGKWIGFALMITLYLLMMAGGTLAIIYSITGYTAPNILQGVLLIWASAVIFLSISFFGGTFLSTLANGVLAFGLFGVAFLGGWIEQIGSFLRNQTAVNIGIISSLIIPSEALWKRAAHLMQSPLVSMMGFSPFSSPSVPSPLMIWYALFYITVILGLAILIFNRRDL